MGEVRESSNEGDELMEAAAEVATIPIRFESTVGLIHENLINGMRRVKYSVV